MAHNQLTTAAALFYECDRHTTVPADWLPRAIRVFHDHFLTPVLFTAGGGKFDDCYVFADSGDLVLWDEPIPARGKELLETINTAGLYCVGLDCPRPGATNRDDARAMVTASATGGELYLGLDMELDGSPVNVLRRAFALAESLFDVRYGFAYQMPLADQPASYASGRGRFTFADFKLRMYRRAQGIPIEKSADDSWQEELDAGRRRHLTGLFRAAYPANVLSEAHLRRADLKHAGIGKLSKLGTSLWLWELADDEIARAEAHLEQKQVLVRQAPHIEPS